MRREDGPTPSPSFLTPDPRDIENWIPGTNQLRFQRLPDTGRNSFWKNMVFQMQILAPILPEPVSKPFIVRMVQMFADALAQVFTFPNVQHAARMDEQV